MRALLVAEAGDAAAPDWALGLERAGHEVVPVDLGHLTRAHLFGTVNRVRRVARDARPHLVVARRAPTCGIVASFACPGTPLVLSTTGDDVSGLSRRAGWHRDLTAATLVRARLLTFESDGVGALLHAYAPATPRQRVHWTGQRLELDGPAATVDDPLIGLLLTSLGSPVAVHG